VLLARLDIDDVTGTDFLSFATAPCHHADAISDANAVCWAGRRLAAALRLLHIAVLSHCCAAGRTRTSLITRWHGRLSVKAMISAMSSAVTSACLARRPAAGYVADLG